MVPLTITSHRRDEEDRNIRDLEEEMETFRRGNHHSTEIKRMYHHSNSKTATTTFHTDHRRCAGGLPLEWQEEGE